MGIGIGELVLLAGMFACFVAVPVGIVVTVIVLNKRKK